MMRPDFTIEESLNRFFALQKETYTFSTYENRIWSLTKFRRYLDEHGVQAVSGLTREILLRYEEEKPRFFRALRPDFDVVSSRTLRTDTTNVRMYLQYLHCHNLTLSDLSAVLLPRRSATNLARPLSPKIIDRWFSLCNLTTHLGLRDRAFFELAYGSGLRPGELLALTVTDLDLGQGQLMVNQTKTEEARVVPLTRTSCYYIREYLAKSRPFLPKCPLINDCLWLTDRGKSMTARHLKYRLGKIYRSKLDVPISLYRLRHSCATHLLREGASVPHVQSLLGHLSINSTQIYTKIAIPDLRTMHRKCHPRSIGGDPCSEQQI